MSKQQVVEFDIDKKNLLRDVISKQTGSLDKAIKELFQNSFDAGATRVDVVIKSKTLSFKDNGCGMSKEEIHKYFRVFGATQKRDDSQKTGTFGMGRGQIFNFGYITWKTKNFEMRVDIKKDLSYIFKEVNDYIDGTEIKIEFYNQLYTWKISDYIYTIKRNILPGDVKIYLNGDLYTPKIEKFKKFSNNKYLVFRSMNHKSTIYNGGLAIKAISPTNYQHSVQAHEKLALNFARNELIENEESTKNLLLFIYKIEELMSAEKDRFNIDEALTVLRLLSTKKISIESVYDKKIIPLSSEKLVSFRDLIDKPNRGILFGKKNVWSDDCIRQDYRVISVKIKRELLRIKTNFNLEKLEFLDKTVKELSRRGYHKRLQLTDLKKNHQYYYMMQELNEYIFGRLYNHDEDDDVREISLGISDIANAWTDGWSYITVSRPTIEGLQNKEEAILNLWEILCHEYSHTTNNTKEDQHNYSFYDNYHDIVSKTLSSLSHCMKYISRKFLKEKYNF